ncbi:MAG: hypothetical protein MHM6MM_002078 [Cercozoa sp. M6MM]
MNAQRLVRQVRWKTVAPKGRFLVPAEYTTRETKAAIGRLSEKAHKAMFLGELKERQRKMHPMYTAELPADLAQRKKKALSKSLPPNSVGEGSHSGSEFIEFTPELQELNAEHYELPEHVTKFHGKPKTLPTRYEAAKKLRESQIAPLEEMYSKALKPELPYPVPHLPVEQWPERVERRQAPQRTLAQIRPNRPGHPFKKQPKGRYWMELIHRELVAKCEEEYTRPLVLAGDWIKITMLESLRDQSKTRVVEGLVIARRNNGYSTTILLRVPWATTAGGWHELVIPLYSPFVKHVRPIRRADTRRSKLYYMRDFGSRHEP